MVKQKGMTLLEMLVALMIMSSVMVLASSAYSYYVQQFQSRDKAIGSSMESFKAAAVWQRQLASAFYYLVKADTGHYQLIFRGNKQDVFWMSNNSIAQPGQVASGWLGERDGQLTYCEAPLSELFVNRLSFEKDSLCKHFSLSLGDVHKVSIEYYGYRSALDKFSGSSEFSQQFIRPQPDWSDEFNGAERGGLPMWVKVVLTQRDDDTDLEKTFWVNIQDDDPTKLSYFYGVTNG